MGVYRDANELSTCTSYALKRGFFDKLQIVDSAGRLFDIAGTRRIGRARQSISLRALLNPQVRVELDLRLLRVLEPSEVRDRIRAGMRSWGEDVDELLGAANTELSIAELVARTAKVYYGRGERK
jgi:hypothetical protein